MVALVTGGAGFIGSHIVDALLARNEEVRVLDDLSTGYADNVPAGVELVEADLADEAAVARAVRDVESIFHQGAARAVLRSVEDPLTTNRANVTGTLTLLTAARDAGVRRVVYASSSSVYGGATERPTPESAPLLPRSPYAVSKLGAEHYLRVFAELYGLETVSLRYFNVYGPRQRPDSMYAAVIPLFIEALTKREPPTLHGDGKQSRDFTFVHDVVAANLAAGSADAAKVSGRAFNVAGGTEVSLLDLLDELRTLLGVDVEPVHVEPRAGDVRHSCADATAAREAMGWTTTTSLHDGLVQTVDWFNHRA